MSNSPAPIHPRVSRELTHERYVEVPGRTRGETSSTRDASRKYAHRHDLPLNHAALVSMLGKGEAVRDRTPTRRLSGPADRACVRPFDIDQAFVQSHLNENVFLRLPKGCGKVSDKVVRLNKRLYGLKQAPRTWHAHLTTCLQRLGFEQCLTDVCVFRLIEDGRVAITAVVHTSMIFLRQDGRKYVTDYA